jgi:hypothetical protein
MEHMSTFVRKMENDLSHGDNMFSMVFTKESITKTLNNLKIGKAPGIDDIPNEFHRIYCLILKNLKLMFPGFWKKPC